MQSRFFDLKTLLAIGLSNTLCTDADQVCANSNVEIASDERLFCLFWAVLQHVPLQEPGSDKMLRPDILNDRIPQLQKTNLFLLIKTGRCVYPVLALSNGARVISTNAVRTAEFFTRTKPDGCIGIGGRAHKCIGLVDCFHVSEVSGYDKEKRADNSGDVAYHHGSFPFGFFWPGGIETIDDPQSVGNLADIDIPPGDNMGFPADDAESFQGL